MARNLKLLRRGRGEKRKEGRKRIIEECCLERGTMNVKALNIKSKT